MLYIWKCEKNDEVWKRENISELSEFLIYNANKTIGIMFKDVEYVELKKYISLVGLLDIDILEKQIKDMSNIEQIRLFALYGLVFKKNIGFNFDKICNGEKSYNMIIFVLQKLVDRLDYDINIRADRSFDNVSHYCHMIITPYIQNNEIVYKKKVSNYKKSKVSNKIVVKPCTKEEFITLKKYHYVKSEINRTKFILGAYYDDFPIGCHVICSPLSDFDLDTIKKSKVLQYMDKNIASCVRLIVHPDYRGLSVASKLIKYARDNVEYEIFESRSVIFRQTDVVKHLGGKIFARDYRKIHKAYDDLIENLSNIGEKLDRIESIVCNDEFKKNEKYFFRLIKKRLYEVDLYQYRYFSDLVKMKRRFPEDSFKYAQKIYTEFYQNIYNKMYENKRIKELLYYCKLWDSDAYIFGIH